MALVITESDNSEVLVKSDSDDKKIVILFPMTRTGEQSIFRWESLIDTVNLSEVSNLVLIDKTENFVATDYFLQACERIIPNLIILQRPLSEAIHDSQKSIRIQEGSWIMQFHDDDDWNGTLEIPEGIDSNSVIRTKFTVVSGKKYIEIADLTWPDCRSIFSLIPAKLWNRFTELIHKQGGHVAGSIDSSLNLAINLMATDQMIPNFTYIYDNRHWSTRRSSTRNLAKLTIEDGWKTFPTIQMSLVGRAIDGIACLIFFQEFYRTEELKIRLNQWIASSKPNRLRILARNIYFLTLYAFNNILKILPKRVKASAIERSQLSINYSRILLKAWNAVEVHEYLNIVEDLINFEKSQVLQVRFAFWKHQLLSYTK
jgi:hypothetical protein